MYNILTLIIEYNIMYIAAILYTMLSRINSHDPVAFRHDFIIFFSFFFLIDLVFNAEAGIDRCVCWCAGVLAGCWHRLLWPFARPSIYGSGVKMSKQNK